MKQLSLVALAITKTKNNTIFMVSTAKGQFSVKADFLKKRGIDVANILAEGAYRFPKPTVVVIAEHKQGDYLFPDNGGVATQDSTRLNDAGEPVYKVGDKPTWTEAGHTVRSFIGFAEFKAQLEMDKLMKELATSEEA